MMICPTCQTENRQGARFCDNCGSALQLSRTYCGTVARPGAKFCDNCGHKLVGEEPDAAGRTPAQARDHDQSTILQRFIPRELAARLHSAGNSRAVVGERRVFTILFCDVKGSTAVGGHLDPEEWCL